MWTVLIDALLYASIFIVLSTTGLVLFSWQYWVTGILLVLLRLRGELEF